MARRPKEARYQGTVAAIVFQPRRVPFNGKRVRGVYDTDIIKINSKQPMREVRMTLLHECMHHLIGTRIAKTEEKISIKTEETICEWSELLVDYLNENPSIREYLFNATSKIK